jgi:hypothetical protein
MCRVVRAARDGAVSFSTQASSAESRSCSASTIGDTQREHETTGVAHGGMITK